jgi:hypothetical protein
LLSAEECGELYQLQKFVLNESIHVYYTNHEGKRRIRNLVPLGLRYGSTKWHPQEQLLIKCLDLENQEVREFSDAFSGNPGLPGVVALAVKHEALEKSQLRAQLSAIIEEELAGGEEDTGLQDGGEAYAWRRHDHFKWSLARKIRKILDET